MKTQAFALLALIPFLTSGHPGVSFDVGDANRTLHLAWSAYCNESALRAWNCEWCNTPFSAHHVSIQRYLKNKKAGTQGYVGIDAERNRIVVAYRGSKNFHNTVQDMKFWMRKPPADTGFPEEVRLDSGFLEAYLSIRNDTLTAVAEAKQICSNCSILFTGHSLGSAMSLIGATEVAQKFKPTKVRLYNFGSPRTGNVAFVKWAKELLSTDSIRMRRQLDIVPAIPPRSIGYEHVHTEVWNKHGDGQTDTYVVCNGSGEDPKCGDSEEHPAFPLDLIHLKPSEHTKYMGFQGGNCVGGV